MLFALCWRAGKQMEIRLYRDSDKHSWDTYVMSHPDATHCHLSVWKEIIENTYHHKTYYLIAERFSHNPSNSINPTNPNNLMNSAMPYALCPMRGSERIAGILPLVHINSFLFGNQLVSMPFLNYGGILAEDEKTERALLSEAIRLGQKLKVGKIEIRHIKPLQWIKEINSSNPKNLMNPLTIRTLFHKVRMVLELPGSSDELFKSYNSKLRSQIRRPQKEGMNSIMGGAELLKDFYKVFSINMRDLGSPVHSKNLFREILNHFDQNVKIGIVNYKGQAVAAGIIFCFRNIVEIPWASSLRKYNQFSPNMLLYWSFLEYACKSGHKYFDFGRSTPEEGTHKFKEQWGAKPTPLYWHNIVLNGHQIDENDSGKSKFGKAIECWKKLPLPISNRVGPIIRKYISL